MLTNTIRTMRALALTLALTAALAGCGGSSADKPQTLPPVTVSPSASPSPAASPIPSGINAATPQGASEFVKYYFAEISRAFRLRDPAIVQNLSLPTCKTCKLYVDSIGGIRDRNERFVSPGFRFTFAVAPADTGRGATARVDIGYVYGGGVFYDAGGKVLAREPREALEEQVALARGEAGWRVATIKRVARR